MGENTAISWADHTFDPWIGGTKVSPVCDHCYAERDNSRRGWVPGWGAGVQRRRTKAWGDPLRWDRQAYQTGARPRVFCASLADVFDNEVDPAWRADLWDLIGLTPNLRWMILTKRIGNVLRMLPRDWPFDFWHVGIMATIANQNEWDRDVPKLIAVPAMWHGVSIEPMLGPVDMGGAAGIDWVIAGGESGPGFRAPNADWVRSLRDQCADAAIAFHFKQWGGLRPKSNGCMFDGREHKAFPAALV